MKSLKEKFDRNTTIISDQYLPEFSELKPVQQRRIITLDTIIYDDLLYYFNKIILNSNVVFASINNLYKIQKNFSKFLEVMMKNKNTSNKIKIIDKLVSKTREDCILFKYKLNKMCTKRGIFLSKIPS